MEHGKQHDSLQTDSINRDFSLPKEVDHDATGKLARNTDDERIQTKGSHARIQSAPFMQSLQKESHRFRQWHDICVVFIHRSPLFLEPQNTQRHSKPVIKGIFSPNKCYQSTRPIKSGATLHVAPDFLFHMHLAKSDLSRISFSFQS
jgi:hypothetical protein